MKIWFQLVALFVMIVVAGTSPRPVLAAPSVGSASTWSTERIINDIIRRTPGLSTRTTTGTGATLAGSTKTPVNVGRGLTVPVPVAAEATVTAGRLAGIATKALKAGTFVGVASVVIPWIAEQSGLTTCPPPDFFCKKSEQEDVNPTLGGYAVSISAGPNRNTSVYASTGPAACAAYYTARQYTAAQQATIGGAVYQSYTGQLFRCVASMDGAILATGVMSAATCPQGSIKNSSGTGCYKPGEDRPATEQEVGTALEQAITGKPERIGKVYDVLSPTGLPMFLPADPVKVSVPTSVPAPDRVSTTTQAKPDGSIDTVQTTVKTEVRPQVNGDTIGNTTITYPTTTTTTTTTTNNVTNISYTTTTVTNVVNNPPATAPDVSPDAPPVVDYPGEDSVPTPNPEMPEIPNDYNREATQQSILQVLKSWAEPVTEQLPDGQAEADAMQAKHDEGMAIVDGISAEGVGLSNWFPTVPTAPCVNPQIPNPVTGAAVSFPICGYVDTFSKFISGVICFFCVLGCVHQVQSAFRT